jgi:hypothetical protein
VFDIDHGRQERSGTSLLNKREAEAALALAFAALSRDKTLHITIVAFYEAQVALLDKGVTQLPADQQLRIKVTTVDAFQGGECGGVFVCSTRAPTLNGGDGGDVQFIADRRRLNVALSRGQQMVFVLVRVATVSRNGLWRSLVKDAEARGLLCRLSADQVATLRPAAGHGGEGAAAAHEQEQLQIAAPPPSQQPQDQEQQQGQQPQQQQQQQDQEQQQGQQQQHHHEQHLEQQKNQQPSQGQQQHVQPKDSSPELHPAKKARREPGPASGSSGGLAAAVGGGGGGGGSGSSGGAGGGSGAGPEASHTPSPKELMLQKCRRIDNALRMLTALVDDARKPRSCGLLSREESTDVLDQLYSIGHGVEVSYADDAKLKAAAAMAHNKPMVTYVVGQILKDERDLQLAGPNGRSHIVLPINTTWPLTLYWRTIPLPFQVGVGVMCAHMARLQGLGQSGRSRLVAANHGPSNPATQQGRTISVLCGSEKAARKLAALSALEVVLGAEFLKGHDTLKKEYAQTGVVQRTAFSLMNSMMRNHGERCLARWLLSLLAVRPTLAPHTLQLGLLCV